MKILTLNCNPDFTWLTSRGLVLEVENQTINQSFPLKYLYDIRNPDGSMTPLYTPDVALYLEQNFTSKKYDGIIVGWNPSDYGAQVSHTGGYTCPIALSSGARWITIRQDNPPLNMYPVHEMMHLIGFKINIDLGDHTPKDFMDSTPVLENGTIVWESYYENDYTITDPNSNFNQTWKNYTPFLDKLNNTPQNAPQAPVTSVTAQTLRIGSKGPDVTLLQQKLGISADGLFGPITQKAVISFQTAHGLVADGIVGPKTWAVLDGKPKTPSITDIITQVCNENGVEPELGIAVATCESGLNPRATLYNPPSQSTDRGLFQWNSLYHSEITDQSAFDPAIATKYFCDAVKAGKLHAYWSASQPCWSTRLSPAIKIKYGI